ncbi:MAG: hypothetical protein FD145_673 [Candidatus Saganbacteria bacterium]|uniref:YtkA-like domain-containing protein n=1 Tax=Candidatus Saganbacteria bacterium TaxID=2575572 RepID=A0A833L1F5_UNCSA|nr:MAG: hypothetical protein FD145_673 [Candidatus Saganbacteria bacterium]
MLLKNFKLVLAFSFVLISLIFGFPSFADQCCAMGKTADTNQKIPLSADYYFIYQFNQKPTLGTSILKVQVFDKNGKKAAPFKITASSGMPSMGNAHDTGEQDLKISKKKDYLLPIDLVMQGEWEIKLIFYKGKTEYGQSKIKVKL